MAKINIKEMKCPCCGAALSLEDKGYGETKCTYCNAIVFISREDTKDGNITICNEADGKPIANISIPLNWDILDTFINYNKCTIGIPYGIGFDLANTLGDTIHVESGNYFAINGPLAWVNRQTPHTIQKEFIPVKAYLMEFMNEFANSINQKVKYLEDLPIPKDDYDQAKDFESARRKYEDQIRAEGQGRFVLAGLYCESACCAYEVGDKVVVAYTKEYGYKNKMGMMNTMSNGFNQAAQGFNNILGNLFGNNNQQQQTPQPSLYGGNYQQEPVEEPVPDNKKDEVKVLEGNINHPGQGENIEWQSDPIFMLVSTKENYKKLYEKAFKQVVNSFSIHPTVIAEYQSLKQQLMQDANNTFQQQAQAQYQNGQNLINIGAQRMAANHSYINSMMDRSNKQFEQQRSTYNSRMAAQDRMRDGFSEAIRGVNTYIKPDGKEVEVPVSADTAWINGKGEIVGGGPGFNPGSGWTQLDKKN